jgi:hypothetical protein
LPTVRLALRILAVVVFATQAAAVDAGRFVCRMTGEVMSSPCCPEEPVDDSGTPAIEDAPCCVLQAAPAVLVAVTPAEHGKPSGPSPFPTTLPGATALAQPLDLVVEPGVRTGDPPGRVRLHLQLRQLLI